MMMPRFPYSHHRHCPPASDQPAVECVDLSVWYPRSEQPALREVSVRVSAGSRVALVGPNGAGKSTLLKAVAGLVPVASGSVRVHGCPVGGSCHRVAYLAQRAEIDWGFPITVRRLVLTGRYVHVGWFGRPGAEDRRIVGRMLELLEIGDLADRRIGELSGGQQQRALLARTMAQQADLLLLDEPLNAVDAQTKDILRSALRSLSGAGKTIVVATHDPHDIEIEFENVLRFNSGRCEETSCDKSRRDYRNDVPEQSVKEAV